MQASRSCLRPRRALAAAVLAAAVLPPAAARPEARPGGIGRHCPEPSAPPWWRSGVADLEAAAAAVRLGRVSAIALSPGGRPVRLVAYGERQDLGRQANYGSALGARDPAAYARKTPSTRPIALVVGPVHGHEVEGMVGVLSLLSVAETGRDLRGKERPRLREDLLACRTLIVPLPNPDGRARCPYASFVGIPVDENDAGGPGHPGRRHPLGLAGGEGPTPHAGG